MAEKKKMSVEEVLAAARAEKSGKAPAPPKPAKEAESPAAAEKGGAEATPKSPASKAAKAAASGKAPGGMSVADILAAARAEKSGGDAAPAATKEKPAAKPAPQPAAAKETPAKAAPKPAKAASAASDGGGEMDTSSILAAARSSAKPGPMSKAQAAAKGQVAAKPARPKVEVPPFPEKPAYAEPRPAAPAESAADRRGFLGVLFGSFLAVGFTTLSLTNLLWLLGTARFMFPNILTEPPSKFKVGFKDDFASGQVEEKFKAQFGVWIVNYEYEGESQIYALRTVCTHLGCTPNWLEAEQKFKCPCHGSGFYKDGINFEGPAPRPLERYAIRVSEDGQLEVDKSKLYFEEKGQWNDPAAFVPV
jgi:cytochrome b6-f complex iron-sulfur subunit